MGTNQRMRRANVRQLWILAALAVALVLIGYVYARYWQAHDHITVLFESPTGKRSSRFVLEVADTEAVRGKGLMFRKPNEIEERGGMIFVFPAQKKQSFWMKNTYTSLDLIFVADDLRVVGVVARAPILSEHPISVEKPSKYVIELHAGNAEQEGIQEGSKLIVEGTLPTAK